MTNPIHVYRSRQAAGWTTRNGTGWWSPHCGPDGQQLSEADWIAEGWPLPESPEYASFYSAFFHYDALDEDLSCADPFPLRSPLSMTATITASPVRKRRPHVSTRITITLPENVARRISEASFEQGRSISNLAAYLLERAVETFPLEH